MFRIEFFHELISLFEVKQMLLIIKLMKYITILVFLEHIVHSYLDGLYVAENEACYQFLPDDYAFPFLVAILNSTLLGL